MNNSLENLSFKKRVNIVLFVMLLFFTLLYLTDFRSTFIITDLISIFITVIIWYKDGILKIEIKIKYILYYIFLLIISLYIFPKELSLIIDIFIHAPLREEIIFRFFMIGIFYKYYKVKDENPMNFVKMVFASNIIFMILHSYNIGIFFIGLIISIIYIKGGLVSSMLAHAIYNLYLPNKYCFIRFLAFIPIIFSISDARALYENIKKKKLE